MAVTDESQRLARRDRVRRALMWAMTPEQRLARMAMLQEELFARLKQSPEAWNWFWRRNLKKRAIHREPPAAQ